ncbi:MAG: hypothetical protein Kow006_27740 [Gammaproteobacteria bacterium]
MPLQRIQQQLQRIYQLEVPHRVTDFLITDSELAKALRGGESLVPEQLLVHQEGDELALALYLEAALLERLASDDPFHSLHNGNLSDYCTVLEGISHFLYLSWNARHDRPVTRLELELQAEVDKFIAAVQLISDQYGKQDNDALLTRLFRAVSFAPELEEEEKKRYWWANRYAARYCEHLNQRYLRHNQTTHLTRELRRFYRLNQPAKLQRIMGRTAPP